MATNEYFDIIIRAKNMVSQGFQQAIAESKAAAAAMNSVSLGGAEGAFGKIGLSVAAISGGFRLAGAAVEMMRGNVKGVDDALSRLPMGVGEAYRSARDLVQSLLDVETAAQAASRVERWKSLSSTLEDIRSQSELVVAGHGLGDFDRQRLAINAAADKRKRDIDARVEDDKAKLHAPPSLAPQYTSDWKVYLDQVKVMREAAEQAKQAVDDARATQIAELGERQLKSDAAAFNARNEKARQIEERQRQIQEKQRTVRRQELEEEERLQDDVAAMKAANVQKELQNAGKLLEAEKARNAEAARVSLSKVRSEDERALILKKQQLDDAAAEADDRKRNKVAGLDKPLGFDLVEMTSRVSGFAAMQKAGFEAAIGRLGDRLGGNLGKVVDACAGIKKSIDDKRVGGINIGF